MDDLFDEYRPEKSYKSRYIFSALGNKQGLEACNALFTGQEDPSAVLIVTKASQKHYSLRESVRYMLSGEKAHACGSGIITPSGIVTNGHLFLAEVPSFSNYVRSLFGFKTYYRVKKPILVKQGITLREFKTEEQDDYYSSASAHDTYIKEELESVFIHPDYIEGMQKVGELYYGKVNGKADLAIIKTNAKHSPQHTCLISDHSPRDEEFFGAQVFHYPHGHLLQKSSTGTVNFKTCTHTLGLLPGSSGSSLRDLKTGKIVGINYGISGIQYPTKLVVTHSRFVPFDMEIAKEINFQLYQRSKNVDKSE